MGFATVNEDSLAYQWIILIKPTYLHGFVAHVDTQVISSVERQSDLW